MLCSTTTIISLLASSSMLIMNAEALPTRRSTSPSFGVRRAARFTRRADISSESTIDVVSTTPKKATKVVFNPKNQARSGVTESVAEPMRFVRFVRSFFASTSTAESVQAQDSVKPVSFGKAFSPRSRSGRMNKRSGGPYVIVEQSPSASASAAKITSSTRGRVATDIQNPKPTPLPSINSEVLAVLEPITVAITLIPNPQGDGYVDAAAVTTVTSAPESTSTTVTDSTSLRSPRTTHRSVVSRSSSIDAEPTSTSSSRSSSTSLASSASSASKTSIASSTSTGRAAVTSSPSESTSSTNPRSTSTTRGPRPRSTSATRGRATSSVESRSTATTTSKPTTSPTSSSVRRVSVKPIKTQLSVTYNSRRN